MLTDRIDQLVGTHVAFVGGGAFCRELLDFFLEAPAEAGPPAILAVADLNPDAPGARLARERGIPVFDDYHRILSLPRLTTLVEVTDDAALSDIMLPELAPGVRLIDHIEVRVVWDALHLSRLHAEALERLRRMKGVSPADQLMITEVLDRISAIAEHRGQRAYQIERELVKQQRALAQIVQGSTIPTFVIDCNHVVTHWNRAMESLTGTPGEIMIGTSDHWRPFRGKPRPLMADVIIDQLPDDEVQRLYGNNWRPSPLIEGAYEAEEFLPRLGENGKWCWFTAAPIIDPQGQVVGAIETLQDVSKIKQAEEERRRHTHLLATLVSIYTVLNKPLGIDERIDAALREIQAFLGTDQICLFIMGSDQQWCLKSQHGTLNLGAEGEICGADSIVQKAASQGKLAIFNHLPDGSQAELNCMRQAGVQSLAYIPIRSAAEEVFGVIRMGSLHANFFSPEELYTLELTGDRIGATMENALLHEELKRKSSFQYKLIRSSTDAIVATDDQMRIVLFNPEAERLFGYTRGEAVNRMRAFDLYPDQVEELWDAETDRSRSWEFPWKEITIAHRSGEVFPVRYSGTILREGDRPMGSVAFFQDLRLIKRLERELLHAERLAAVGQTVAGMAHCIKNILHGFKGGSYLLDIGIDRGDLDKMRSGWRMVERNIGRISDLVLDLLSYSKEREPELDPTDPNAVASEVCDLMDGLAEENRVEIVRRFAADIGTAALDARIVHRALLNLVSNAIDACTFDSDLEKKHRVWVRTARPAPETISFEVEDNGMGMSDEVKSHLFMSFFSTKGARGTGLGLLVTRKLIEEHHGRIEVRSEPGRGTCFTVTLPASSEWAVAAVSPTPDKLSMPGG